MPCTACILSTRRTHFGPFRSTLLVPPGRRAIAAGMARTADASSCGHGGQRGHHDKSGHKQKNIELTETNENELKDKTIVLSREAHVLLNNIKYEQDLKTISNAIEYLCKHWESIR